MKSLAHLNTAHAATAGVVGSLLIVLLVVSLVRGAAPHVQDGDAP